MITPYVRNFKRKSQYLWNFSCPICGDSKTNQTKARGYVYRQKHGLGYKCHNCSHVCNLGNLLKQLNPELYKDYSLENYKESGVPRSQHKGQEAIEELFKKPVVDGVLESLSKISALPADHPARQYCSKRLIPTKMFDKLYLAPKFMQYCNKVLPNPKFGALALREDVPRLVIPYLDKHGRCFAFQGRAFGNEQPKYYTIKIDEESDRIFGLDRIDYSKRVYVVEGPIDSLFLSNCLAVSGSSFHCETIEKIKANCTIVFDNEPRSFDIIKLMGKVIDRGFSICFWPDVIADKDINEMILSGLSSQEIKEIIDTNTHKGPEAKLKLAMWRKC